MKTKKKTIGKRYFIEKQIVKQQKDGWKKNQVSAMDTRSRPKGVFCVERIFWWLFVVWKQSFKENRKQIQYYFRYILQSGVFSDKISGQVPLSHRIDANEGETKILP